jgi:hypothetical protein
MRSAYLKYLRQLLIFSGIIAAIVLSLHFLAPGPYVSPAIPFLIVFFAAASLLSFYYLLHATENRFVKFVNTFLLTILIKLFLYAGVMIAYVVINRKDAVPFMLGFFILYLCFTAFESVAIIRYTKPPSNNPPV